jgi:hypothetical protein
MLPAAASAPAWHKCLIWLYCLLPPQRSPAGKRSSEMVLCQRVNFSEKELPVFDDPVVGFSPPHALQW